MGRPGSLETLCVSEEGQGAVGRNRSRAPDHHGPRLPQQQRHHRASARRDPEDHNLLDIRDAILRPDVELAHLTQETTMADDNKGLVAAGAALVWRRQRVLWWVYAVNLVLGLLGAAGARTQLDHLLRYSLAGESLTKGFDLGMFFELVNVPAANLMRSASRSFLFALLFPLFMLFVTGGILAVYREDRKFTAGEFFAASGAFFWRFVRLVVFSLVPFGLLGAAFSGVRKLSDYLGDRATPAQTGFYILLAGATVVVLLVLFVRRWSEFTSASAESPGLRWQSDSSFGPSCRQPRPQCRSWCCSSSS